MHLYVSEIRVLGHLWVGSGMCPVTADITITFQGNKTHMVRTATLCVPLYVQLGNIALVQ